MPDENSNKLDMDELDVVAGGSAIDAINAAIAGAKPRQGDSLQYPYGAAPFNSTPVNPGIVSPDTKGPLETQF